MILDIDQNYGGLDISYLNKDGNKAVRQIPVPQYTQWHTVYDMSGTPGYKDISGKEVMKTPAKSFRRFDLLEFMHSLPQDIQDDLFDYRQANMVASDIETDIGDRFPKPELAEQPVTAISAVDSNLTMIMYTTLQATGPCVVDDKIECEETDEGSEPEIRELTYVEALADSDIDDDDLDEDHYEPIFVKTGKYHKRVQRHTTVPEEINRIITEHVGHLLGNVIADVKVLQFDTERQMLEAYFSNVVKFSAVLTFWNGDQFDVPYLVNRCKLLGIPLEHGSITGKIASATNLPKHTVIADYMQLVKQHGKTIKNIESYKLDYIAFRVLGIGKLPYRGTLKHMMLNDVPGYLAYCSIDSILVQLIHQKMNLLAVLYGFAHVCKLPMAKADSQVAQTESLISLETLDMLDFTGVDMPEKQKFDHIQIAAYDARRPKKRPYGGGHVKQPFRHTAEWFACVDFSGQYPSIHRTCNLSVENFLGPIDQFESKEQAEFHHSDKYFVSVNNNVYRNDRDYSYKRIQIYLRAKRDVHGDIGKKHLYLQQPFIEYALYERGLWHEKPELRAGVTTLPWTVEIDGKKYTPDLCNLNEKDENGEYKDHVDFLWFLFHTNLREGFFHFNMQTAFKLVSNSLYGATANEYNGFGNVEVADDTTAEGRNSIVAAGHFLNNWCNYEWQYDKATHEWMLEKFPGRLPKLVPGHMPKLPFKDRILYIDTDSLYIEYLDIMEAVGFVPNKEIDQVDFFAVLYEQWLGAIINQRLADMMNSRGGESMMKFDLEYISASGVFRAKKMYTFALNYDSGRKYSMDDAFMHLKTKGMSIARTAYSPQVRSMIRSTIVALMRHQITTKGDYLRCMLEHWQAFQTLSIEDISTRVSISADMYEKYIISDEIDDFGWRSRTLPQYRGAMFANYWLRKLGLDDTEPLLKDGSVCFYEDMYGNPFSFRILECPKHAPEPNLVMQFIKTIVNSVNKVAVFYDVITPLPIGGNAPTDDISIEELVKQADEAMQEGHKNRV